jgi:heavy metal sensor kinase
VRKRISIRRRLTLVSWSLALVTAVVLALVFHLRTRANLLAEVERTLGTKCDEVITVLESRAPHPTLEEFLWVEIETNYRSSPYAYVYQVSDAEGRVLARSANLGDAVLPVAGPRLEGTDGNAVLYRTERELAWPGRGHLRVRSERLPVAIAGGAAATLVIQTGLTLEPLEAAARKTLIETLLWAASALAAVFFLLWFVTARSLRPVAAITRKASRITSTNLRERLPLAGSGDELDQLARVLNEMLDRLEGSLHRMEEFSSDAAHQLRTPLTRIRGELDLILRGHVPEATRSQLERVEEEIERMSRLCGRLLLLARVDSQSEAAALLGDRVDLEDMVSELLEQTTPLARDRGVRLGRGPTSAISIQGSRPLLVEAFLNLLDNAIRCTPEGGEVEVSLERQDGHVRLAVRDTGPGVPTEERERIFHRLHRIPRPPAGPDEGTGLGLAIVRAIAQAHGGRVELECPPGGGSIFGLVLPIPPRP